MLNPMDQCEEKILLKLRELPENTMAEVLDFVDFLRTRIVSRREKEVKNTPIIWRHFGRRYRIAVAWR